MSPRPRWFPRVTTAPIALRAFVARHAARRAARLAARQAVQDLLRPSGTGVASAPGPTRPPLAPALAFVADVLDELVLVHRFTPDRLTLHPATLATLGGEAALLPIVGAAGLELLELASAPADRLVFLLGPLDVSLTVPLPPADVPDQDAAHLRLGEVTPIELGRRRLRALFRPYAS